MTQEEKQLLLKDLCARLPYGVECKDQYGDYINVNIYNSHIEHLIDQILSGVIQMVLRPMSSMTEEESNEYLNIDNRSYSCPMDYAHIPASDRIDWLLKNHFDFRGLIPMGLAIEAPEGIYNN